MTADAVAAVPGARHLATQEALCASHYGRLVGYAYALVGDSDQARDVAQEAFVRLFARWTEVRHPQAYLYLVATNIAKRHWRRRRSEDKALGLVAPRPEDDVVPAYDPALADALGRLPRRCRQVVVLHYLADLPVEDVAAQLRLAPGSVKRLLHEARARLAEALEER